MTFLREETFYLVNKGSSFGLRSGFGESKRASNPSGFKKRSFLFIKIPLLVI